MWNFLTLTDGANEYILMLQCVMEYEVFCEQVIIDSLIKTLLFCDVASRCINVTCDHAMINLIAGLRNYVCLF